jgi:hypothetical protein
MAMSISSERAKDWLSIFDRLSNRTPTEKKVFNFGPSVGPRQKQLPNVPQGLTVPVFPEAPRTRKIKNSYQASASPVDSVPDLQSSASGAEKIVGDDEWTSKFATSPDQAIPPNQTAKVHLPVSQTFPPSKESSLDVLSEELVTGSADTPHRAHKWLQLRPHPSPFLSRNSPVFLQLCPMPQNLLPNKNKYLRDLPSPPLWSSHRLRRQKSQTLSPKLLQ